MLDCEIFHIYNRGVEKKEIFLEDVDRVRFIHDMYEFNDITPAPKYGCRMETKFQASREKLVKIHAFSLMPNHYHMLCEQVRDKGMSLFIKKLQGGYARAFNEKYERNGYLFQGKYQRVVVTSDRQLFQVACYIHANPLDLWKTNWRENRLTEQEIEEAVSFLKSYRWSSHLDYIEKKNFPSVIDSVFLRKLFGEYDGYEGCFRNWLKYYEKNQEIRTSDVRHKS